MINNTFTPPSAHAPCTIAPAKTAPHRDYGIAVDLQHNIDLLKFDLKLKFEGEKNWAPNCCLRWPILSAMFHLLLRTFSGPESSKSAADFANKDEIVLCTMVNSVAEFREC